MYEIVTEILNPTCEGGIGLGATAINDHNVVVGNFAVGCGFDVRPFMWSEDMGFVAIAVPSYAYEAEARDISNNGEIVGRLALADLSGQRAFRYKDGEWTVLPPTGDGIHSEAFGINDEGWVCGYRDTNAGRVAFRWRDEFVEEISSPVGSEAVAHDIDSQATATGNFGTLSGYAFLWTARRVVEIPSLPDAVRSRGDAIVSPDSVTGGAVVEPPASPSRGRSWFFDGNTVTDLGVLPDLFHTQAVEMNAAEQIVGRCTNSSGGNSTPFLWQHGEMFDLESLIVNAPPGLNLSTANAINNFGWIAVGRFVLRPVDRPLGDVNIDCVVDERDLVAVLDDWGPNKVNHPTDQVTSATFQPPGDGVVDAADLAVVLGNWSISTEASARKRRR